MVTEKNSFVKRVLGQIVHVTSVEGYCGIQDYGFIKPNLGNLKHTFEGQSNIYYCQKRKAVSLLDLQNVDRSVLFDSKGWNPQNWHGVFTYHDPAIVLLLEMGERINQLFRCSSSAELIRDKTKFILEAEACFPGEIPQTCIRQIIVVSGRSTQRFKVIDGPTISEKELVRLKYSAAVVRDRNEFLESEVPPA